jgi:hypothetical protein
MQNLPRSLHSNWNKLIASIRAGLTNLVDNEPTKWSWAVHIKSYADVPEVYKAFFKSFLAVGQAFPYTVLTPSFERFIHRTTEKLICDTGSEINILERRGDIFEATCYPVEGISYVEVRTILLDSSIKVSGFTKPGNPASTTFRFNSVTDYLFTPILETIRQASVGSKGQVQDSELEKFDRWARLNFKFMNYARRSLLGGEKVIHTLLQPEIRARELTFLGMRFYRVVSPAHVSILTDRELIMIREEKLHSGAARYGGIWDYIPLRKIVSLSLEEKKDHLLELSIQMPAGEHLEYLFQSSAKEELDKLLAQFRALTTRISV